MKAHNIAHFVGHELLEIVAVPFEKNYDFLRNTTKTVVRGDI